MKRLAAQLSIHIFRSKKNCQTTTRPKIFTMNYRKDSKVLISRPNKCKIGGKKRSNIVEGNQQQVSYNTRRFVEKGSKDRRRRGYWQKGTQTNWRISIKTFATDVFFQLAFTKSKISTATSWLGRKLAKKKKARKKGNAEVWQEKYDVGWKLNRTVDEKEAECSWMH